MEKVKRKPFAIWWVDDRTCRAIGGKIVNDISVSVLAQLSYRLGRPGRCRLWIPDDIDFEGVKLWPQTYLTHWLDLLDCGGIVVAEDDAVKLKAYPGILTTLDVKNQL